MATAATVEAVDLPFQEAINFFAQKTNVGTKTWTDVWQEAHARAFMVAGAASEALVDDFRQAIHKAIAEGTTLAEFRKDFDKIVEKRGWTGWTGEGTAAGRAWRTRVIFETNLNMAYAAGRYAQMTDPDVLRVYPYWVYRHSGNPHPRLQHKAWDGLTLAATDPFWMTNYPPNGFNCGCTVEPVSARGLARQGKSGPDEAPPLDIQARPVGTSGKTALAPAGVDPGFAYNPGMAWKGEVAPPHDAVMKASPGWTPPPPAPPPPPLPAVAEVEPMPVPRNAAELDAADRRLREHYDAWAGDLSGAERGTLQAYKGSAYESINMHLDGRRANARMAPVIETLDGALAKAPPTNRPMTLFRGISRADPFAKARVGSVFQQRPFMSTSIWRDKAAAFAGANDGIVIEIRVPQAYHGVAWVHPYPEVQHVEWEMLFRPGGRYRIVSRDENRMVVEAIDEPKRKKRLAPRRTRRTLSG